MEFPWSLLQWPYKYTIAWGSELSLSRTKPLAVCPLENLENIMLCLVTFFIFHFQKLVFGNIKCWSFRKSVGWWVSNAGGCKIWSWKQRISQRRPVETGQRSSDDEVSKLILHDRKMEFFWRKLKMSEWLTSSLESVYIVFVERLLICLVIVAMVEGCNRSSLLVSVLYRPNEEFSE